MGSVRPNLSKACQKTKLCAFFIKGSCPKSGSCNFAHGEAELKCPPNLQRTRLCPAVIAGVKCSKMATCKFAHSAEELRQHDMKNNEALKAANVPSAGVSLCDVASVPSAAYWNHSVEETYPAGSYPCAPQHPYNRTCVPIMNMALGLTAAAGMGMAAGPALGLTTALTGVGVAVAHAPGVWFPREDSCVNMPECAASSDVMSQRSTDDGSEETCGEHPKSGSSGSQTPSTSDASLQLCQLEVCARAKEAKLKAVDQRVANDHASPLHVPSGIHVVVRNTFLHVEEESKQDVSSPPEGTVCRRSHSLPRGFRSYKQS